MLEEALARHRARLRFTLALRGLERGLLIAAPLALLVALLVWRRLCPESLGGQELTLFLFSVFGLAGLVVGWCTPLSRPTLIAAVDQAGGFGAGLLTVEDQRLAPSGSRFSSELASRVETRLAALDARRTFPVAPPRHLRSLLLFGALILLVISLPRPRAALQVVLRRDVTIRAETSQSLAEAANRLRAEDGDRSDVRDIARSAQTLARDLESESDELGGALERIGAIEESIERLRARDRRYRAVAEQLSQDPLWQRFLAGGPAPGDGQLEDALDDLSRVAAGAPELADRLDRWKRDGGGRLGGPLAEAFRDDLRRLRDGDGALSAESGARLARLDEALNSARRDAIGESPAAEAPESETPASDASGDGAPETDPAALAAASSSKTDHEAVKEALEGKAREGGPADASADPAVEAAGASESEPGEGVEQSSGDRPAGDAQAGDPEAGSPDAGRPDAGSPDAGSPEAGSPDSGQTTASDPGESGSEPTGDAADRERSAESDASDRAPNGETAGAEAARGSDGDSKIGESGASSSKTTDKTTRETTAEKPDSAGRGDRTAGTPEGRDSARPDAGPSAVEAPDGAGGSEAMTPEGAEAEANRGADAGAPDAASRGVTEGQAPPQESADGPAEAPKREADKSSPEGTKDEPGESGSLLADMAAGLAENLMDMGLDPSDVAPDPDQDGMLQDWARAAAEKLIDSGFKPPQELMDKVAEAAAKKLEDTPPDQLPKGSPERREWQERIAQKLLESGLRPPSGEALERLREAAANKAPGGPRRPTAWEQDMAKKLADAGFQAPRRGASGAAGSGSPGGAAGAGERAVKAGDGSAGPRFQAAGDGPGSGVREESAKRGLAGRGKPTGSTVVAGGPGARAGSGGRPGPGPGSGSGRRLGGGAGPASLGGARPSRAEIDEAIRRRRIPRSYERAVKAYFEGRREAADAKPPSGTTGSTGDK